MKKKKKLKFAVKKGNGQWWFHIKHANGQIILTSETYTRKSSATKSMVKLITAISDGNYEIEG